MREGVKSGPFEGNFAFMFFLSLFLFLGAENLIFLGLNCFTSFLPHFF